MAELAGNKNMEIAAAMAVGESTKGTSDDGKAAATTTVAIHDAEASALNVSAGPFRRRNGKELVEEMGTEEEKKSVVINLAKAQGSTRMRFLAVGIFMSILAVSCKTLIDNMMKVWRIRGTVDINQLRDL